MKSYLDKYPPFTETIEQIEGVRVGKIVRIEEGGQIFVDYPDNIQGPVEARITGSVKLEDLRKSDTGKEVLLVFENNDPKLPIVIDTMHSFSLNPLPFKGRDRVGMGSISGETSEPPESVLEAERPEEVIVDGKKVIFDAKDEIVLRCGKASITLTRAGKILIRGAYLLNRSSGVNRIKGGSVQIN